MLPSILFHCTAFLGPSTYFVPQTGLKSQSSCRALEHCYKRNSRVQVQVPQFSTIRRARTTSRIEEPSEETAIILEGDLLAYRHNDSQEWKVGAVTEVTGRFEYDVRPVYVRDSENNSSLECFVDWRTSTDTVTIKPGSYSVKLLEADYEERIVQDRLANPHGEVSEDCWRVSSDLIADLHATIPRI